VIVVSIVFPIVIAAVFPVFVIIPLAMLVPFVPVLHTAVFAFPVAFVVAAALVVRTEPSSPAIWR
jgi:hypothetical protein